MSQYTIRTARDLTAPMAKAHEFAASGKPFRITIEPGEEKRRDKQNNLSFQWYKDISRQWEGNSISYVRALNKARFGVTILIDENPAMRESLSKALGHLTYEEKIEAFEALEIPITSLMTVKQMARYLTDMQQYWCRHGFRLTDPEDLKYRGAM